MRDLRMTKRELTAKISGYVQGSVTWLEIDELFGEGTAESIEDCLSDWSPELGTKTQYIVREADWDDVLYGRDTSEMWSQPFTELTEKVFGKEGAYYARLDHVVKRTASYIDAVIESRGKKVDVRWKDGQWTVK